MVRCERLSQLQKSGVYACQDGWSLQLAMPLDHQRAGLMVGRGYLTRQGVAVVKTCLLVFAYPVKEPTPYYFWMTVAQLSTIARFKGIQQQLQIRTAPSEAATLSG